MTIRQVIPLTFFCSQTDIDNGLANSLPAGSPIFVIDTNNQPTGKEYRATGITTPIEGSGGIKNNLAATTAPTSSNDTTQGYNIGSRWIDTTNNESYICTKATNPASWSQTTVGIISEVAGLQTALDGKSATTHNHDTAYTVIAHGTNVSNPHSVTKTQVGLGSADNTADSAKPVSTAQQTALNGKSATTHNHTGTYEPSNANIQSHVTAAHAPANAEANLQPDWNQATITEDDFIKNKPTIPAAVTVNNTLTSTSTTEALSAAQGKVLQDGKQDLYEGTVALRTPNNLTSNTSDPNYILTASSEHTVHLFYRAFDGNDANHWYTAGTTVANGVIELRYKIRPTNLLLRGETTILEYWTRWQLQGSNNGTTWDTLVDRSGVDEVIQNTSKNFPITTTKEYKYFRFNGLNAVGTNIPLSRLEISGVESERNFIDWTSYTPIVTSESGAWSNYTATGRYRIVDKMLTVSFRVQFSSTSTTVDAMYVSIPSGLTMNASVMTGGAGWDTDLVGFGIMGDSGTISGVPALIATRGSQRVLVKYYNAAASSYLTCPGLTNIAPWIWNTLDTVDGQFTVPIL